MKLTIFGMQRKAGLLTCCLTISLLASACSAPNLFDSPVIKEAKKAEKDGRLINNELMAEMYPNTYQKAYPQYLERDFEAGADFICDEIKRHYQRDICAEPKIAWRR